MSDPNANTANSKKTRLGRGLGSLLGAVAENEGTPMPDASAGPTEAASREEKPRVSDVVSSATAAISNVTPTAVVVAPVAAPAPVIEAPKIPEESQIWKIPVERLRPNTQQPRQVFIADALRDLAASIKEKGILQPIVARRLDERSFEIIAGERRWRAAQLAGLLEVPVILRKTSEQDSLELAIIENIQRENLNPLEEAEAYDRLMSEYNLTQQLVADKVGKERATIANSLRLLLLPREVKEMLKRGELSSGHAKAILAVENPIEQVAIAKRALADKLSVRATEKLVARTKVAAMSSPDGKPTIAGAQPDVRKRMIEGLASELQRLFGTKVTLDYSNAKGKLNIHFYSDAELNSIVDKIRDGCSK